MRSAQAKRAKAATAETVSDSRVFERSGEQLDPTITPADIREQVDRDIGVADIAVLPGRLRALWPEKVEELTESIRERGLLQAIVVRPRKDATEGFWLVAGRHRLEAIKKLKLPTIRCKVRELGDDEASLIEIDENLIRAGLSPAERALHTGRRKELYEKIHPETRHGGAPGKAGGGKKAKDAKLATFAEATAQATGQSRRKVERDAARARYTKKVLADVVGTSLDKGDQLDALGQLPASEQEALASAAKAGEKVSAKQHVEGKAVTARDIALREFNEKILRLVQMTRGHKPERFAKTSVDVFNLLQLGRFLTEVAAAASATAAPAKAMKAKHADAEQMAHEAVTAVDTAASNGRL